MDRAEFAKLALEQLKKARPGDISILDLDKFLVVTTTTDGKSSITSLSNYYDEYEHAAPDRRQGVIERIGRFGRLVDGEEKLDEVRVMLVPRIRPRRYFEIDALQLASQIVGKHDPAPKVAYYTPLAEYLGVGVAIDRPEHIEYVGDPARFEVPGSELDAIALANIRRMTKSGLQEVHPGLWLGAWEDEYAAERMLMPELFTKLAPKGEPVVFMPGPERIYVVGSEDEAALALAVELVDQRLGEPRGLLSFAFVLHEGTWRLFEAASELGRELGARLCRHLADAYAVQRKELEARFADADDDAPFVAGVIGVGDDDGNLRLTVTTWGADVHAYLPRTQVIGIARADGGVGMVPWEDVMALTGDALVQVPELYPPRWETKRFPDASTLEKLLARAIDKNDERERNTTNDAASIAAQRARRIASASVAASRESSSSSRMIVALVIAAVVAFALVYALSH